MRLPLLVFLLVAAGCASQSENTAEELAEKLTAQKLNESMQQMGRAVQQNETMEEIKEGGADLELCTDSDGGENYFTKGIAGKGGKILQDRCTNGNSLEEYYCGGPDVKMRAVSCPQDYACTNGACNRIELPGCIDTDGGQDIYARGELRVGGRVYTDICSAPDTVREYFCNGDFAENVIRNCPPDSSCSDGACVRNPQVCIDSDNGLNATVFGEVNITDPAGFRFTYPDKCESSALLKEYACIGSNLSFQIMECSLGRGEECLRAACQKPVVCTDSDDGIVPASRGAVTVIERFDLPERTRNYEDSCSGTGTLTEYYCSEDRALSVGISCNGTCSEGAC